jgi:hypothetical protein
MGMLLYKPTEDKINYTTSEQAGFNFNRMKCLKLIRNLQYMYQRNRGKCEDGYVQLCGTVLQSMVHDYKKYMDWMEKEDIISINYQYKVGESCRHYRLNYPYDPNLVEDRDRFVQIPFIGKLKFKEKKKSDRIRGLGFLKSSLNGLTIDDRTAYDISEEIFQQDLKQPRIRMKKGKYKYEEVEIDPFRSLQARKDSIVSIGMKDFYCSRDETTGRVHSNLTSFTSKLFSTIKYKGQPLVGYDIANSQPFLASVLLRFILNPIQEKRGFNPISSSNTPKSFPKPLLYYINTYLPTPLQPQLITIMLEESLSEADFTGVSEFQLLCESGNLYGALSPRLFDVEYTPETQHKIKYFFFTLLFTKPLNQKNGIPKFKTDFPAVHKVISEMKNQSPEKGYFPRLLQCVESYFILEKVCKRMHKEHPKAPIFTKHDSIYTIEEYRLELLKIMQEESMLLFGVSPTFRPC